MTTVPIVDMGIQLDGFSFACVEGGVVGHAKKDQQGYFWFVPADNVVLSTTVLQRIEKKLRELNKC